MERKDEHAYVVAVLELIKKKREILNLTRTGDI